MASIATGMRQTSYAYPGIGLFFRLVIILNALALAACAPIQPQVQSLIVNDRVISGSTDQVQVIRAGQAAPAAPGATLQAGDVITTGPGSQAVLLLNNGAVEVVLLEESEVHISSIFVKLGEVFVRVTKKLREKFEVESEYGVAAVEGTEFIVSVHKGSDYRCVTLQGQVEVRSAKGKWPSRRIRAKQELTLNSGSMPMERTLDQTEYNSLIRRVNNIERIYRPNSVQLLVPDVSGLMESEARRTLQAQNLAVGTVVGRVTSRAKIGEVLSQTPAAGQRIRAGASVQLEVEAQPTTVPNVTGINIDAATSGLQSARLKRGTVTSEISGQRSAGEVIRQQPLPGVRVPVDSAVDLWVEAESRRVPSVVNLDIGRAQKMIIDSGLRVGSISKQLTEGVRDGTVLGQGVAANTLLTPGTQINLTVAELGIRVPSVINNSRSGASQVLSAKGLKLGSASTRPSRNRAGNIFEQNPAAGTLVKPGSTVSIVIAGQCRVPNVKGLTYAAASNELSRADLVPVKGNTGNYDTDKVYGQNPRANSSVNCGSSVRLDMGTVVVQ